MDIFNCIESLSHIPPTCGYITNFISSDEEDYLIRRVYDAPKPKWTQLTNRRLQNWGGLPHRKGMVPEKIPEWLSTYCERISSLGVFGNRIANHVLVNEYLPGQGIMPHLDGDLYYPTISTITLGSHTVLDFYEHLDPNLSTFDNRRKIASLLLEPRSLLILKDDMYVKYLHGIDEKSEDHITEDIANITLCAAKLGDTLHRSTRISLTIRHVPKVLNLKLNKFLKTT